MHELANQQRRMGLTGNIAGATTSAAKGRICRGSLTHPTNPRDTMTRHHKTEGSQN
jgi:hypothetical protein